MRKEKADTKIPEFKALEEEKKYWEARGPLAEGHRGKLNKPQPKIKRTSFLSVRLTGEELTQLQNVASRFGVSPSTYVRSLIRSVVDSACLPAHMAPSFLFSSIVDAIDEPTRESFKEITSKVETAYEAYVRAQNEAMQRIMGIYGDKIVTITGKPEHSTSLEGKKR